MDSQLAYPWGDGGRGTGQAGLACEWVGGKLGGSDVTGARGSGGGLRSTGVPLHQRLEREPTGPAWIL